MDYAARLTPCGEHPHEIKAKHKLGLHLYLDARCITRISDPLTDGPFFHVRDHEDQLLDPQQIEVEDKQGAVLHHLELETIGDAVEIPVAR